MSYTDKDRIDWLERQRQPDGAIDESFDEDIPLRDAIDERIQEDEQASSDASKTRDP